MVDKAALGQVSSEYFSFPCQFSFHWLLHAHHLSPGAGTIGQTMANMPSGLSLTPPQEKTTLFWEKLGHIWYKVAKSQLMHCHEMNNLSSMIMRELNNSAIWLGRIRHCVQHFLDVSVSKLTKSKSILTFWYETKSSWVAIILGTSISHVCIPLQGNISHSALEGESWFTHSDKNWYLF
jgi:hypothetical protein